MRQALAEAEALHRAGFTDLAFELKEAEGMPKGVDVDLAVIAPDGSLTEVYQFVSKTRTAKDPLTGELKKLPRGFGGDLSSKMRTQLADAPAKVKYFVAEYPQATMADYLARQAALDMSLSAFRAGNPGIIIRIELSDGVL